MENDKKKKIKKLAVIAILIITAVIYNAVSHRSEGNIEVQSGAVSHAEDDVITDEKSTDESELGDAKESDGRQESETEAAEQIFVDVGGAVKYPRVVCIGKGARVFEAVEAAGGVAADAETKYLNMAAECSDGQKIYVPTIDEVNDAQNGESNPSELFSTDASSFQTGTESTQNGGDGKININTATSEQLQTLDGIGPSMAARIIEYRQSNGNFKSVDELTNVSGIGEKTLAKFVSDICV